MGDGGRAWMSREVDEGPRLVETFFGISFACHVSAERPG